MIRVCNSYDMPNGENAVYHIRTTGVVMNTPSKHGDAERIDSSLVKVCGSIVMSCGSSAVRGYQHRDSKAGAIERHEVESWHRTRR